MCAVIPLTAHTGPPSFSAKVENGAFFGFDSLKIREMYFQMVASLVK